MPRQLRGLACTFSRARSLSRRRIGGDQIAWWWVGPQAAEVARVILWVDRAAAEWCAAMCVAALLGAGRSSCGGKAKPASGRLCDAHLKRQLDQSNVDDQ